jgi:hypothetical protein
VTVAFPTGFVGPAPRAVTATVEVRKGGDLLSRFERQVPVGAATLTRTAAGEALAQALGPDPKVCPLPALADDLALAGGGRYLLLVSRAGRRLLVFEAAGNRVAKSIPLLDEDAQVAGGERKFVVLYPKLNSLHRFDLGTLEQDFQRNDLPADRKSLEIAMGSRSDGPILWAWLPDLTNSPAANKARPPGQPRPVAQQWVWYSFIDLDELKEIKLLAVDAPVRNQPGKVDSLKNVKYFQSDLQSFFINVANNSTFARASADSDLFAVWTWPSSNILSIRQKGNNYVARMVTGDHTLQPPYFPAPDGRSILLSSKVILDQYGKKINSADPKQPGVLTIPTSDPALSIVVNPNQGRFNSRQQVKPPLSIVIPDGTTLVTIEIPMAYLQNWAFNNITERLTADKRLAFDPASQRLMILTPENDRIVSFRLDVDGAFNRLAGPPIVTSPTLLWATAGQDFRHQITARSTKGGLTFSLSGGMAPAGLAITSDGTVTWKPPSKSDGMEGKAAVTIKDAAGQQTNCVLKILVR